MSKLKNKRERLNLTQEELATKSGISIRTIQRIESGIEPKGHTLKTLAKALDCEMHELLSSRELPDLNNYSLIKIINLSSVVVTFLPPANIVLPLLIMLVTKQFNPLTKQIVSLQIVYTIFAVIIFMLSVFSKKWFELSNTFTMIVMVVLVLTNVFIILRNTAEIDKQKKLRIRLNFDVI